MDNSRQVAFPCSGQAEAGDYVEELSAGETDLASSEELSLFFREPTIGSQTLAAYTGANTPCLTSSTASPLDPTDSASTSPSLCGSSSGAAQAVLSGGGGSLGGLGSGAAPVGVAGAGGNVVANDSGANGGGCLTSATPYRRLDCRTPRRRGPEPVGEFSKPRRLAPMMRTLTMPTLSLQASLALSDATAITEAVAAASNASTARATFDLAPGKRRVVSTRGQPSGQQFASVAECTRSFQCRPSRRA
ncbi:unnamed protein product, partial [Protopolystoma xenopodis]